MKFKLSKTIDFLGFYGTAEKRIKKMKPAVEIPPELKKKISKEAKNRLKNSK